MTKEHSPERLDVKAFAHAGGHLSGHDTLLKYQRLAGQAKGLHPDLRVDWQADAQVRSPHGVGSQLWLRLRAEAVFPMLCQRCLHTVDVPLCVDREFRFVADEATAEAQDGDCEEDLLVLSREFNLRELIEDELLLALPLVPRHEQCPTKLPLESCDAGFGQMMDAKRPNPFAALAHWGEAGTKP